MVTLAQSQQPVLIITSTTSTTTTTLNIPIASSLPADQPAPNSRASTALSSGSLHGSIVIPKGAIALSHAPLDWKRLGPRDEPVIVGAYTSADPVQLSRRRTTSVSKIESYHHVSLVRLGSGFSHLRMWVFATTPLSFASHIRTRVLG